MSLSFPYKVDYNDHFETPSRAYEDILPLLDAVSPTTNTNLTNQSIPNKPKKKHTNTNTSASANSKNSNNDNESNLRQDHILYDPYYCNGSTKQLLQSMGFDNVQHDKRDFYKDVEQGTVPMYHTLITNPPYSADHKVKCLQFAMDGLMGGKSISNKSTTTTTTTDRPKPFFLLMPNYIATKEYFQSAISIATSSESTFEASAANTITSSSSSTTSPYTIMYVVPPKQEPYEYHHPENTGKDIPPFQSIWFCGIPTSLVPNAIERFQRVHGKDSVSVNVSGNGRINKWNGLGQRDGPILVSSLKELMELKAVPVAKRLNPRQRRKQKMRLMGQSVGSIGGSHDAGNGNWNGDGTQATMGSKKPSGKSQASKTTSTSTSTDTKPKAAKANKSKKKSIYRDEKGVRKKRRF